MLALTPMPLQTAGERALFAELTRWDTGASVRAAVVASHPARRRARWSGGSSDAVLFVPEGVAVVRIVEVVRQSGVVTAKPEGAWTIGPGGRPGRRSCSSPAAGRRPLDGLMRAGMDTGRRSCAARASSPAGSPGSPCSPATSPAWCPADGDLGEGDQVALLEPRSLLLGIARASRYAGVDNPRLWTTADVRAALEALGLAGPRAVGRGAQRRGLPYSPYVLRRPELLTPAAMAASPAAAVAAAPPAGAAPHAVAPAPPDPASPPGPRAAQRRRSPGRRGARAAGGAGRGGPGAAAAARSAAAAAAAARPTSAQHRPSRSSCAPRPPATRLALRRAGRRRRAAGAEPAPPPTTPAASAACSASRRRPPPALPPRPRELPPRAAPPPVGGRRRRPRREHRDRGRPARRSMLLVGVARRGRAGARRGWACGRCTGGSDDADAGQRRPPTAQRRRPGRGRRRWPSAPPRSSTARLHAGGGRGRRHLPWATPTAASADFFGRTDCTGLTRALCSAEAAASPSSSRCPGCGMPDAANARRSGRSPTPTAAATSATCCARASATTAARPSSPTREYASAVSGARR